ncbi:MAG: GDP-mannose-dependent alpha-(1-6)-phosphatidylinositol monomannoside mannosyltransferase [candidate division BRC1 bacterium ADurb.BinA364]|nr:MAG: GDP-mannose-dependent alpha-(1-6)-phosphatidylinositol monomannoside mannosyltransferase [candidate division BRC1 bacterium ADurb.BinA364]
MSSSEPQHAAPRRGLLLADHYPPMRGGIARYLETLVRESSGALRVVAPREPGAGSDPAVAARVDFFRRCASGKIYKALRWWIEARLAAAAWSAHRAAPFDCAIAGSMDMAPAAARFARRAGIPWFVCAYGNDLCPTSASSYARWEKRRHLRIAARADGAIAISRFTAAMMQERGIAEKRIAIVYPALPLDQPPARACAAREEALRGRDPVALSVGGLVARKNHLGALDALAPLRIEFPALFYAIAGAGPMEREIRRKIDALGMSGCACIWSDLGDAEIEALYSRASVFLLPSLDLRASAGSIEGFGIVYLEAARAGLPCVAGRAGGAAEAVLDEETGLLADPADPASIRAALARLFRDPLLRQRLGQAARRRFEAEFTARRSWEAFERAVAWQSCAAKREQK